METAASRRLRRAISTLALASALVAGVAVGALAQAPYQAARSGQFQNAASVDGLPVVYLSFKDAAESVQAFGSAAASSLKVCDKKRFDKAIADLRSWQSWYSQTYDTEHAKAAGLREHDLGELAAKADARAEVARDDANSIASIINWLLLKQNWEHCKPPTYRYTPGPRSEDVVRISVTSGVISGDRQGQTPGATPSPSPAPSPIPVPAPAPAGEIDPFQNVDIEDIQKAIDKQFTGEVGLLEQIHDLDLREKLNVNNATISRFKHTVDPIGVYAALHYHWAIGGNFMLGASASLQLFNINNRQYFFGGSSWGTHIGGYGALTAQLMYSPSSMRNIAFFVEAGGALASQTISATFAPAFSSNALVPGVLVGGGVKIAVPPLGRLLGRPVFFTLKYAQVFLAKQTVSPALSAFHYTASSQLRTISAGLEVRF